MDDGPSPMIIIAVLAIFCICILSSSSIGSYFYTKPKATTTTTTIEPTEKPTEKPTETPTPDPNAPVDAKVSEWGPWPPCQTKCGFPATPVIRRKTCIEGKNGGKPCPPQAELEEKFICPATELCDASVSVWSAWTPENCPIGCGLPASTQKMTRACLKPGGIGCTLPLEETAACRTTPACPVVAISSSKTRKCLSAKANGEVVFEDCTGGDHQKWILDAKSTITNKQYKTVLDTNGIDLYLSPESNTARQIWVRDGNKMSSGDKFLTSRLPKFLGTIYDAGDEDLLFTDEMNIRYGHQIYSTISGLCLGMDDNVGKFQVCDAGKNSQKWDVINNSQFINRDGKKLGDRDNGIRNAETDWDISNNRMGIKGTDKCIAVPEKNSRPIAGDATIERVCGHHYRELQILPVAPGTGITSMKLHNPKTNQCLDMNDAGYMTECVDSNTQRWTHTGDGLLKNVGTGRCLNDTMGNPVCDRNQNDHLWERDGERMKPKNKSGKSLQVRSDNSRLLELGDTNNSEYQIFRLTETEVPNPPTAPPPPPAPPRRMIFNPISGLCLEMNDDHIGRFVACDATKMQQNWDIIDGKKFVNGIGEKLDRNSGKVRNGDAEWEFTNSRMHPKGDLGSCISPREIDSRPVNGEAEMRNECGHHYREMHLLNVAPTSGFTARKLHNYATDKCLDMDNNGGYMNNCVNSNNQHWTYTGNGILRNVGSGKCLNDSMGSVNCDANQKDHTWTREGYELKPRNVAYKSMEINANTKNLYLANASGNALQRFNETGTDVNTDKRRLNSRIKGYEVSNASGNKFFHRREDGILGNYGDENTWRQKWDFKYDEFGPIRNTEDGTCVTINKRSDGWATLEYCNGDDNQQWYLRNTGEIASKTSPDLCLRHEGDKIGKGNCEGNSRTKWNVSS